MSFKNKMKNMGTSKLDDLVETPNYIKPIEEKRKTLSLGWVKIAVPVLVSSLIVIAPLAIILPLALGGAKGAAAPDANQNVEPTPESHEGGADYDQELSYSESLLLDGGKHYSEIDIKSQYNTLSNYINIDSSESINDLLGDKISDLTNDMNSSLFAMGNYSIYHFKNSDSFTTLIAYNGTTPHYFVIDEDSPIYQSDPDLNTILNFSGIKGDYHIDVYDNQKGASAGPIYNFDIATSTSIVNSFNDLNSSYSSYLDKKYETASQESPSASANGDYRFSITDGVDIVNCIYYSNIKYFVVGNSAFDLTNTSTLTLLEKYIDLN